MKLRKSFPEGSWMRSCADRVPEQLLFTDDCWWMILREILTEMRPFLNIQKELLIEQFLYKTQRDNKCSYIAHVSRFQHLKRELTQELGEREVNCPHCTHKWSEPNDFPDSVWSYCYQVVDDSPLA